MTTQLGSASSPGSTVSTARQLIALDIDGTLVGRDGKVSPATVDALDLVRAAGHHVVLATGRSLVGLLPVATRLGLTQGFAVCSNGTMTVRLDPQTPLGYVIDDSRRFDPGPVIRRALAAAPGTQVAVEEVGWGWHVNTTFERRLLNGDQKEVPVVDLCAVPATRIALHAREISRISGLLVSTGVTVTPAGNDWLDLTAQGTSKATALERLRGRLDVQPEDTVAVGDGLNDLDMLDWAGRGVAMGHAPGIVRDTAAETTGTIDQDGAAALLHSLLPAGLGTAALSRLAAQLATAIRTAPGTTAVVRVWHGPRVGLSRCEVWSLQHDAWRRHAPVPAAAGVTMRGIENAAREAGLAYLREATRAAVAPTGEQASLATGRLASSCLSPGDIPTTCTCRTHQPRPGSRGGSRHQGRHMSDERRDWLAGHLAAAAARFGVTVDGDPVRGSYDRTLAVRTSGPAWLRVTAQEPQWARGEYWDGIATARGAPFDAVPMPRHLRSAEWADGDQVVRADLVTFVDEPAVGSGLVLDHSVDLPATWWTALRSGLDALRTATGTERRVLRPEELRDAIRARFGVEIDLARVQWEVAHGDLHFGNLTGPRLTILDWEYWGWAPAGYDAAVLACSAVRRPDVAARVRAEFADVLGTCSGTVAQLAAAEKYLRLVDIGAHPEIEEAVRQQADVVVRERFG